MLTNLSRKFAVQEAACLVIGDPPHDPGGGEGVGGGGGGGQRHQRLPERSPPRGLGRLLLPRVVHLRLPVQERREDVLRDLSAKTGFTTCFSVHGNGLIHYKLFRSKSQMSNRSALL